MRQSSFAALSLSGLVVVVSLMTAPAQAGQHGRLVSVQGAGGRGYVHSRQVNRQPGTVSTTRSTQTNNGQGVVSSRSAAWNDGVYQGGATHAFNDGTSASRSATLVNNGDGTVSYDAARTRRDGSTHNVSGTAARP